MFVTSFDETHFQSLVAVLDSKILDEVVSFETKVDKLKDFQPDSNFRSDFVTFLYRQSEEFNSVALFHSGKGYVE